MYVHRETHTHSHTQTNIQTSKDIHTLKTSPTRRNVHRKKIVTLQSTDLQAGNDSLSTSSAPCLFLSSHGHKPGFVLTIINLLQEPKD